MILDDVCELIIDTEHKTAPRATDGYPSIRTPNIGKGRFLLDGVYRVSEDTYKKWTRRTTPKAEDLILAREAPVGNVAMIPEGLIPCLGQRTVLLRPNKEIIVPKFLCYYLLSYEMQNLIASLSSGATVAHLNMKDIRGLELGEIPSLPLQIRVADILCNYDDLIENNLKRIKLLEQAAQNIYKEWFVNLRFPGHENTPINEETGLPQGWCKSPFNKVSINNNRKRIPINSTERSKRQGNYRYYGATKAMDYIDDYIFDGRYLLIAEDGTVYDKEGNAFTQLVEGKFWVNNHAHIISGDCLPVEFLYLAMKHYPIGHLITGAVQLKLSMKNLSRVDIINPSEEILQAFMSIVNPMINQVFTLDMQNQKLKAARDILLPRLMNRTIEV
jgi:type I restriction enzyme S subunit